MRVKSEPGFANDSCPNRAATKKCVHHNIFSFDSSPGSTGINHHTKDLDVSARMLEKHSPRRRGSKSFSAIQHGVAHLRYNQGFAQETAQIWLEVKGLRFLRLHRF